MIDDGTSALLMCLPPCPVGEEEDNRSLFESAIQALESELANVGTHMVIDSAVLGGMYSTGTFSGLKLCDPNTVRFRFIGGLDWEIEVLPRPEFRVPWVPDARGLRRPFGFSRHFRVRAMPRPDPTP